MNTIHSEKEYSMDSSRIYRRFKELVSSGISEEYSRMFLIEEEMIENPHQTLEYIDDSILVGKMVHDNEN